MKLKKYITALITAIYAFIMFANGALAAPPSTVLHGGVTESVAAPVMVLHGGVTENALAPIMPRLSGTVIHNVLAQATSGQLELRPPLNGACYIISTPYVTPASTPGVLFKIQGSSTNKVEILRIWVSLYADNGGGTTSNYALYLNKRSTAGSGGTSTSVTPVPVDSNDSAATCSAAYYTANPTAGTLVGQIGSITTPVNYNACPANNLVLFDAIAMGRVITLNGTAEGVTVDGNSVTIYTTGKILFNALVRERK